MKFDVQGVAIVGGGPAGAIAALTLARLGHRTTVLERNAAPRRKPGEVLGAGALALLQALGLSALLDRSVHTGGSRFMSSWWDKREELPGRFWLIDRATFETDLSLASERAGVIWRRGWRLADLSREPGRWRLAIDHGASRDELTAARIIDASGRASVVARRLAGPRRHAGVGRVAAWAESPHDHADSRLAVGSVVVHRKAETWWYAARLPSTLSVVAVGPNPPREAELFAAQAREAGLPVPADRGAFEKRPSRHAVHESFAAAPVGCDWLAVGDAVASIDPLAGYGLTFAIGSGYYAARAIDDDMQGMSTALPTYGALVDDRAHRVVRGVEALYGAAKFMSVHPM